MYGMVNWGISITWPKFESQKPSYKHDTESLFNVMVEYHQWLFKVVEVLGLWIADQEFESASGFCSNMYLLNQFFF